MKIAPRRPVRSLLGGALLAATLMVSSACTASPSATSSPDETFLVRVKGVDYRAFEARHPGLHVMDERSPGWESVAVVNYDPQKLPPQARQDTVGFGHLGSDPDKRNAVVYQIWVQEGETTFYVADFDPATRSLVREEGTWFLAESKDAYVQRQWAVLDDLLQTKPS